MVCAVLGLCTPSWCRCRCPEKGTISIDWVQLSRFCLKTETDSSLRNVLFRNMNRTVFSIKTVRWIITRNIIFVLMYNRHKFLDFKKLSLLSGEQYSVVTTTHTRDFRSYMMLDRRARGTQFPFPMAVN
jgi:hypothetical protein